MHSQTILFYFSSGFFLRKIFKKKESTHFIICNQIHRNLDGGYPPIPDIPTSAGILVYSFRRINFTTFSDFIHTNQLSIYFHFALLFFQCVDIILLQIQNTFDFQNTLRKHYTLRNSIHSAKTLHIEKKDSLSIFKTLWKNITHWEINSFCKNITHWETISFLFHLSLSFLFMCRQTLWQTQITLQKHYTLRKPIHFRFSKHFEKTLHIEKSNHSVKI